MSDKRARAYILWGLTIIGIFLWWMKIHPFVILDTDDWTYISDVRLPIPLLSEYNPIKVLPEELQPFTGFVSAYLIYPLTGDYIGSLSFIINLEACVALISLLLSISLFLSKQLNVGIWLSSLSGIFFLLLGLIIYKEDDYLFYVRNVTCFFNYLLPGIINVITAIVITTTYNEKKTRLQIIIFAILVYVSINSNLFHSIILTAWMSSWSLFTTLCKIKKEGSISYKILIKENCLTVVIDIIWFLSMFFEANGGRASSFNVKTNEFDVVTTFKALTSNFQRFSKIWIGLILILIIIGIYLCLKETTTYNFKRIFAITAMSGVLTGIYLILLCTKVSSGYVKTTQVIFGMLFYIQLLAVEAFAQIIKERKCIEKYLVIGIIVIAVGIIFNVDNYWECNMLGVSYQTAKAIDEDIIDQAVTAYNNGQVDVTIKVPYCGDENSDGFPFATTYGGERISKTLYRHGLVGVRMNITLERDFAKNEEFGLD